MSTAHIPVTVNFNVEIDASGEIVVFGSEPQPIINPVVCHVKLPVNALYDEAGNSRGNLGPNSMFEFWEPSTAIGTREATLSGSDNLPASEGRDYTKMTKKFVMDMQTVLDGEMDASGAAPFDSYIGQNSAHYVHNNFGRLALSAYAHYIFGHVAATAAITNDQAFMDAMLSKSRDVDGVNEYKFATTADVDLVANPNGSNADANLAVRILNAIIGKVTEEGAILEIVEQVLGQDASRAMDQDNNKLPADVRQALKFINGDKVYINIKLDTPDVILGNSAQKVSAETLEAKYSGESGPTDTQRNYTLEITLDGVNAGADFSA